VWLVFRFEFCDLSENAKTERDSGKWRERQVNEFIRIMKWVFVLTMLLYMMDYVWLQVSVSANLSFYLCWVDPLLNDASSVNNNSKKKKKRLRPSTEKKRFI